SLKDGELVLGIDFIASRRIWLSYGSQQIFLSRRLSSPAPLGWTGPCYSLSRSQYTTFDPRRQSSDDPARTSRRRPQSRPCARHYRLYSGWADLSARAGGRNFAAAGRLPNRTGRSLSPRRAAS